jgi:hypothetical protein
LRELPFMPLLVASALGSMPAAVFALVLVANVSVLAPLSAPELASAASERKISASDGAGTVTLHEFDTLSHGKVLMSSAPISRPSDPNAGPSDCPAHVMFPLRLFVDTLGACKYLVLRQHASNDTHAIPAYFTVTCWGACGRTMVTVLLLAPVGSVMKLIATTRAGCPCS